MKGHMCAALYAGVSLFAATTAHAEQADAAKVAEKQAEAAIVVTGTRLVTNGANTPTPVTVMSVDQFAKLQPTTVTEGVNLLPALQGSQNVTSRPGGGQRNGAGAYFNLRNMGNLRTLVLVDGNRLIPTINQNEADTDAQVVPQLLLKRVDVVTGGVSAVYGSDAISGVINFVTDRDFNGFKAQVQQGISTVGDDPIFDIGAAWGKRFADGRGHIEFSYQYHRDAGILDRSVAGRSYADANTGAAGNGGTIPYYNVPNQMMSNYTYGGLITNISGNGALKDLMFTANGQLTPFVHGMVPTATGLQPYATGITYANSNFESGGSGVNYNTASLKAGIYFHQAFGRADYDFNDNIHGFVQGSYSAIHSFNNYQMPNISDKISYANPFLLDKVQAPYLATLQASPSSTFTYNQILRNQPRADQYTDNYSVLAGLEGKLGDYKWTVNLQQAQSVIKAVNQQNIDNGRLYASLDAVRVGGNIICRASQTNTNFANCAPLNVFGGMDNASQGALSYIFTPTYNINRTKMTDINASIAGEPFSTWAGPVKMALSAEYRSLTWDVRSNASPNDLADCAGSTVTSCVQGKTGKWFFNTMGPLAPVTQRVAEGAIEAEVPLLRDQPFFKDLSLTGAMRFTHYNTSGDVSTWKLGLDWRVNSDLRFRATRSRDIRAPNLFELYSPVQINPNITGTLPSGVAAPLVAGATVSGSNTQLANPNLTPEKASTFTVGGVLTPSFLPRFTMSVDYYKIDVNNVIFLLQGFGAPMLKYCLVTAPTSPLCSMTQVSGSTLTATSTYLNLAALHTWGIDTEVGYRFDLFKRPLNVRAMVGYQPQLDFDQGGSVGLPTLTAGGAYNTGTNRVAAQPKWKMTGVVSYDATENFNVTVLQRWRSGLNAYYDPTVQFQQNKLPSMGYTTLTMTLKQNVGAAKLEWFANVTNLFNKFPTVYYAGTQNGLNQGLPEGDDPIGRYFTLGLRMKM